MSSNRLCAKRPSYLLKTTNNLDEALSETLDDIRNLLHPSAKFVVESTGIYIYDNLGVQEILSPGTSRMKELDPFVFISLFGRGVRGSYAPNNGRIFLREEYWCKSTIIHEMLHSVSIFASNVNVGFQYDFLNEGLTEFLTGYILCKQYPNCYEAWKQKTYPEWCDTSRDYTNMARIWYTFCRFVDFEIIKKLYFGIEQQNWGLVWNRFIGDINNAGYNFHCPLRGSKPQLQDRFLNQCKRSFGRTEVTKILEMDSHNFDYSLIKLGVHE